MVDLKKYTDNLPNTSEELLLLAEKNLKEKVLSNPVYIYNKTGLHFHSGTAFSPKCEINLVGCLVFTILGKDYSKNLFIHPSFFSSEIFKKLTQFDNYLRKKI